MLQLNSRWRAASHVLRNVFVRNMSDSQQITPRYKPTNLEKRMLVWSKKFKNIEEVPQYVPIDAIERARSKMRIRASNIMILLTVLASFGAVLSGKAAAKRGESVHQQNLDWHKQYNDDYEKKEENKK